jgi:hypothetical protein
MIIVEQPYKINDIVTLKVLGGDEVVGRLTVVEDGIVTINKPHAVMMGQQGFGLVPYIMTAGPDVKVEFKSEHILSIVKTYEGVAKEYIKQTSGIVV